MAGDELFEKGLKARKRVKRFSPLAPVLTIAPRADANG
jgi:hypothetical protein